MRLQHGPKCPESATKLPAEKLILAVQSSALSWLREPTSLGKNQFCQEKVIFGVNVNAVFLRHHKGYTGLQKQGLLSKELEGIKEVDGTIVPYHSGQYLAWLSQYIFAKERGDFTLIVGEGPIGVMLNIGYADRRAGCSCQESLDTLSQMTRGAEW